MKLEGYLKPALLQIQWMLSLLMLFNTFIIVYGRPWWFEYIYWLYPVLITAWLWYYFKRGRKKELENMSNDNPVLTEIRERLDRIERQISRAL